MNQNIKNFIANGDTEQGLKLLLDKAKEYDKNKKNTIISISSKFNRLRDEKIKGIIKDEEFRFQINKINDQILEFLDIEENALESAEVKRRNPQRKVFFLIAGLIIIGLLFTTYYSIHSKKSTEVKVIHGYIYDTSTNSPIENAKLEIYTLDDTNITEGDWFTDSEGFYRIKANREILFSDYLIIHEQGCSKKNKVVLNSGKTKVVKELGGQTFTHEIQKCISSE